MITVVLVSSDLQELSVGRKYINASLSALIDYTHTLLMAFFRDYPGCPGEPVRESYNQSGFYCSKRQWVALASAGPYASLHLAPYR